jgi:heme/copper-type cytochrome/quinol oxidase subunit 2
MNLTLRVATVVVLAGLGLLAVRARQTFPAAQDRPVPGIRELAIHASGCRFTPDQIEAWRNDRVRLTLTAEDDTYSFVLDEYRVMKQFAPGRTAIVEFLAERPGTFVFYNSLTRDSRCTAMRGELIVH